MSKRSTYLLEGGDCEHELGGFESDSLGEGTQEWVFFARTRSFLIRQITEIPLFSEACLCESKQRSMKAESNGFDSLPFTGFVTVTLNKEMSLSFSYLIVHGRHH